MSPSIFASVLYRFACKSISPITREREGKRGKALDHQACHDVIWKKASDKKVDCFPLSSSRLLSHPHHFYVLTMPCISKKIFLSQVFLLLSIQLSYFFWLWFLVFPHRWRIQVLCALMLIFSKRQTICRLKNNMKTVLELKIQDKIHFQWNN